MKRFLFVLLLVPCLVWAGQGYQPAGHLVTFNSSASIFGDNTSGTLINEEYAGTALGRLFTASSTCTINKVYVYARCSTAGNVKVAVTGSGDPANLIIGSNTESGSCTSTAGWIGVSLGGSYQLSSGTSYRLLVKSDQNIELYGASTGGDTYTISNAYATNWPSTFSWGGAETYAFDIYATYE